ncbi:MAG TPA: FtsW/RodA/SpoVE family cell cycle protein, partial [Phototrophicaceae bacterium]|nr:FtsW/RodA/SpoVE family cell cycle protein [Phototrophicaceae bacterium]
NQQVMQWLPLLVWMVCAAAGHFLLQHYLPQRDPILFPLAMFLSGWGLVVIDRLAPYFADRQAIWLVASVAAMGLTATLPHLIRWLKDYRYLLLIGGLVLLVSTIIFGTNPSGEELAPQLWLGFGGLYFQPSEALKVILVAFLASYLAEQYPILRAEGLELDQRWLPFSPRIMGPILLMWGLCVVVLVWQRDLGTAMLFFIVFLVLLYIASGYTLILVSGAVLTGIAGFVGYHLFDVVQLRIDIWLNPWLEAEGRAYQIVQSLMAFASGGVFGQGVGQGLPTLIPVVHSDFVFAAVSEEWGLLGSLVVVICFIVLVTRGLRISTLHQEKPFYALFAVGLSMLIATQGLLIMGGVLKLVPLTGVTLPFMSYGGSSLLMTFVILGLLLRLSTGEQA